MGEFYDTWIVRQQPADVRVSTARRHRTYFERVILPIWRDVPLDEITVTGLRDFRSRLGERTVRGKPIKMKAVRNILD